MQDLEPDRKQLKLSLERPYKDDEGNPILPLLDVTSDGQQIFDQYADLWSLMIL